MRANALAAGKFACLGAFKLTVAVLAVAACGGKTPNTEQARGLGNFSRLFHDLAEPALRPHYHALSPQSWQWLKNTANVDFPS